MGLRIACDLDGTLADMEAALQREAERVFGRGVELRGSVGLESMEAVEDPASGTAVPARAKGLTDRQMRQLWDHVCRLENFWCSLAEIEPGAVARLAALTSAHQWEVIFLTQRPATAGETSQVQSQRWLAAHGFELPSVYVMNGSRGKVAAALGLDAVLDDRAENCLDVAADSKARPLLVWRGPPETIPPGTKRLGIEPVFSIAEALEILQRMMAAARPPTLAARLRNAIGI